MLAPGLPRDMPLLPLVSPCSLLLNLSVPFLVGATQAPIQRVNINCFRYHNNKVPSVGIIQVDRRPHMGPSLIGADRPQRPVSKEAARVCCRSRNVRKVRWSCPRRYLFFFSMWPPSLSPPKPRHGHVWAVAAKVNLHSRCCSGW